MSMRDRSGPWAPAGVMAAGLSAITWASPAGGQPIDRTLVDAARQGAVETVAGLLEAGADVDAAGPDGTTALHWAAQRDDRSPSPAGSSRPAPASTPRTATG